MPSTRLLSVAFLIACSVLFCFSQQQKTGEARVDYLAADKLYAEAGKLSAAADNDPAAELLQEKLNRQALLFFRKVIADGSAPDTLLLHAYVKAGLICHYFDSLPAAYSFYNAALSLRPRLKTAPDSLFFKPTLFVGSIHYTRNLFDSALLFYKQAERIADKYPTPLEESERLYNRLGAMYFESGNYRMAGNYFQKALTLLSPANPSYRDLLVNYKMNIAANLVRTEDFQQAEAIYRSILSYNIHLNEINHNLGIIYLRSGNHNTALSFLRKVKYENKYAAVELNYNLAVAFSGLRQKDSTAYYVSRSASENKRLYGKRKNTAMALLYKFLGDEKMKDDDVPGALRLYHAALTESYPSFNDADIHSEPETFSGVISFTEVFSILTAKAAAFEKLYFTTGTQSDLVAAFRAYRAAFDLADYVAGTYNSDEARLFLNKSKYAVHDKAIQNSLTLYEKTKKKYYLDQAYLFDQRNKASALLLALQENNVLHNADITTEEAEQQALLRSAITRLSLKANRIEDPVSFNSISNEIREKEIALSRIKDRISEHVGLTDLESAVQIPHAVQIQQMLDDKTVLLSYHLSEKELLVFTISSNAFGYIKLPTDLSFQRNISLFISALHEQDPSRRYSGEGPASALYDQLIKPLLPRMGSAKRLIIIPDDELNYIPFEALQDEAGNYLVQNFSVQYRFSTALLNLKENRVSYGLVLAFAPFIGGKSGSFTALPYSKEEVSGLKGRLFMGAEATKKNFTENANRYPIVQLATHASANDSLPMQSYIAFNQGSSDSADENILYAQEIYNLRLDSINLVILSACETGLGKLVRGEGLMSITRAFSYAGCPNIITSLWKATDKTTAYLTQRLHVHLSEGYHKDIALQLAKTDLLNNKDISPSLKTPNYWAHLIFIGNYRAEKFRIGWGIWVTGIILAGLVIFVVIRKRSRKRTGATG
ncbi:MAG: CHAT domain-containing tetratricopeptide repeat protein [Ferruginibacter sp.]